MLGLIYYNYRHYEPSIGRWLMRDLEAELEAQNLFLFADNDSINKIDIHGKCPALLLIPATWVIVDVIVKATAAAAVTVFVVEVASNVYQNYKEECGKCVAAGVESRQDSRTRESKDPRLNDCIEACWRLFLPSRHGDGAEFQRCIKHCLGF